MIVVKVELHTPGWVKTLGTMCIDNIGGTEKIGDYRVRVFRKGAERENGYRYLEPFEMVRHRKPIREGRVLGHRRLLEPVWNLVLKSLGAVAYGPGATAEEELGGPEAQEAALDPACCHYPERTDARGRTWWPVFDGWMNCTHYKLKNGEPT